MRSLVRCLPAVCVAVVLARCTETVNNAATAPRPGPPRFEIVDGAHNNGNPHFFFLPPLTASSTPQGTFDASESPIVTVCQLVASSCGSVIEQFSMTTGTGAQIIRVDATDQLYIVNWATDQCITGPCTLPVGNVYRIAVLVGGTELGHADVQVDANQQQAKSLNTGEVFALVDGRTLPIKFRIEQGAVFVVGPSSQTQTIQTPVTSTGSSVSLVIPPNALSQSTGLTVIPAALPTGTVVSALVGGTVYDFGPTGTTFTAPVTITIQYDPAHIPSGVAQHTLRLFTLVNGVWQLVPGSGVNTSTHSATGVASHFSTYGVGASAFVTAGGFFSCGIGTSGVTVCWGDNNYGELADTLVLGSSTTPVPVFLGTGFLTVSTGEAHACAVGATAAVLCWGDNASGQLGVGTTTGPQHCAFGTSCSQVPVVATTGDSVVSAGFNFSCAVDFQGTGSCWGDNTFGNLGNGTTVSSSTPVTVTPPAGVHLFTVSTSVAFFAVDTAWHACGIAGGGAGYCWGDGSFGELGVGTPPQTCLTPFGTRACATTPAAVAGGLSFQSLSAGADFTCGVVSGSGKVYCWGANAFGQLGVDTLTVLQPCSGGGKCSFVPAPVLLLPSPAVSVTAGAAHACALLTTGSVYCWGANFAGALGNGSTTNSSSPVLVSAPGLVFTQVSAGAFHTCGIANTATTVNTAYCWGSNFAGQLGDGTTTDRLTPVAVATLP